MRCLKEGNHNEALRCLQEVEGRLAGVEEPRGTTTEAEQNRRFLWSARAETYGNLGVLHRKRKDMESAVLNLSRAMEHHRMVNANPRIVAATHLNLAACHLEAGAAAGEALRHAEAAIDIAGQLLETPPCPIEGGGEGPLQADDCAMLAVAYHKAAEAHERLKEWSKASHAYTQAYEVVRRGLGPQHHLTKAFEKSTRCPRHTTGVSTPSLPLTNLRRTTHTAARLPSIPRLQGRTPLPATLKYDLTFEQWPPKGLSEEERSWYRMARQAERAPSRSA